MSEIGGGGATFFCLTSSTRLTDPTSDEWGLAFGVPLTISGRVINSAIAAALAAAWAELSATGSSPPNSAKSSAVEAARYRISISGDELIFDVDGHVSLRSIRGPDGSNGLMLMGDRAFSAGGDFGGGAGGRLCLIASSRRLSAASLCGGRASMGDVGDLSRGDSCASSGGGVDTLGCWSSLSCLRRRISSRSRPATTGTSLLLSA